VLLHLHFLHNLQLLQLHNLWLHHHQLLSIEGLDLDLIENLLHYLEEDLLGAYYLLHLLRKYHMRQLHHHLIHQYQQFPDIL
tara:strand:- start:193 stop:438 length:246 start_codon:yes stop_codon:yes gene_type:complete